MPECTLLLVYTDARANSTLGDGATTEPSSHVARLSGAGRIRCHCGHLTVGWTRTLTCKLVEQPRNPRRFLSGFLPEPPCERSPNSGLNDRISVARMTLKKDLPLRGSAGCPKGQTLLYISFEASLIGNIQWIRLALSDVVGIEFLS